MNSENATNNVVILGNSPGDTDDSPASDFWSTHPVRPGRLHVLVEGHTHMDLQRQAAQCAPVLAAHHDVLSPVRPRWLHLTITSLPTLNEVESATVRANLRHAFARHPPAVVSVAPPVLGPGGLTSTAYPVEPLDRIYRHTRQAIEDMIGPRLEPPHERFWPHIAHAYSHRPMKGYAINQELRQAGVEPATMVISRLALVTQTQSREREAWRNAITWTSKAVIEIGQGPGC
jgi:2'-5' RNA ligase